MRPDATKFPLKGETTDTMLNQTWGLALAMLLSTIGMSMTTAEDTAVATRLVDELTQVGVSGVGVNLVPVPPPIELRPNDDALKSAIAPRYEWSRFTRDSPAAPIVIQFESVKDDNGERVGHVVSFRFVAHQPFAELKEKGFLKTLFEDSEERKESSFEDLDADQVEALGVTPLPDMDYGLAEFQLLKRIIVRGVFASQTIVDDSLAVTAWQLINDVDESSSSRATWSPLENDDVGRKVEGERKPYTGIAGYVSMASLSTIDAELADACLVEGHFVIHEPEDWFRGGNLLRSKLPLIIQESVRSFRRKLK